MTAKHVHKPITSVRVFSWVLIHNIKIHFEEAVNWNCPVQDGDGRQSLLSTEQRKFEFRMISRHLHVRASEDGNHPNGIT